VFLSPHPNLNAIDALLLLSSKCLRPLAGSLKRVLQMIFCVMRTIRKFHSCYRRRWTKLIRANVFVSSRRSGCNCQMLGPEGAALQGRRTYRSLNKLQMAVFGLYQTSPVGMVEV
jgi:hypothetical protein